MEYRREIDGLRALAVLAVILFHAGFETFSGGFVGVDVFFVISGYLITTIIVVRLEQGNFSLINFYERRARRLLPALFLVMAVCMPFAWFRLSPSDMKDFAQSLAAVSVFASNFLFWRESGYFDTVAGLKPLLHTWSLAVEEQYYVLFPVFLMLCWKLGKRRILVMLGLVLAASLALAQWAAYAKPAAAFYLLPTRGWELLIGAFAAFYLSQCDRKAFGKGLNEFGGWLGFLLILYAVFAFSNATPFPGVYALVPALGAVLIILFATQQTTVGRFIGNSAFVGIGLTSYSAYLWHQPLFAFARHGSLHEPSTAVLLLLSLLSILLGYLGWRFVETPFRKKNEISRKCIFLVTICVSTLFAVLGLVGILSNGFTDNERWNDVRKIEDVKNQRSSGFQLCEENEAESPFKYGAVCVIGDRSASPSGILWGDSYAASAVFGIDAQLKRLKKSYYAVLSIGCPPVPGASREGNAFDCFHDRQQEILDSFNADNELVDLIWVGRFRSVAGPVPSDGDFYIDGKLPSLSLVERKLADAFSDLIKNKKRVVFVLEGADFELSIPDYLVKAFLLGVSPETGVVQQSVDEQRRQIGLSPVFLEQFDSIAYVDGIDLFCKQDECSALLDSGSPVVVDWGHISHEASEILAMKIFGALENVE